MEISAEHLIDDLRVIGAETGDHLALGLSFKSIGRVTGGPLTLITALQEAIGPKGTLMMNTYTEFFSKGEIERGWVDYVFDVDSTRVNTGIVPELFRQQDGTVRSRHPALSVAASGKYAEFLTEGHDEHANAYQPFANLSEIGGKYLAIGIGDRLVGFRHHAQSEAGLLGVVPWFRSVEFKNREGRTELFTLRDRGGCAQRLPELVADLREAGLVSEGRIGEASAILVSVPESIQIMTAALRNNPERNLCDRITCYWCRELERRLDLFDAIESPRYFQSNRPAVGAIACLNRWRQTDSLLVARIKQIVQKYHLERAKRG
ncbi:MAG: AAC(3) family N-acetyltransferase [Verrucomicrobiales bacterium]